jgi:hypothetical protein
MRFDSPLYEQNNENLQMNAWITIQLNSNQFEKNLSIFRRARENRSSSCVHSKIISHLFLGLKSGQDEYFLIIYCQYLFQRGRIGWKRTYHGVSYTTSLVVLPRCAGRFLAFSSRMLRSNRRTISEIRSMYSV